ncbi:VOC family protein [Trinickia acidisoli]|uniref:VOC family protein n=1 Tax=Trinickia acidisoli TaxID=2767482 RepID=UPI001A90688A|nr:VOC family protein [Trinickia acidisoli]
MTHAFALELDHLVVVARTLDEGARYVADTLGVEPVTGGTHAAMGTHNRLLALWGGAYLEIIAIDPQAERDRAGHDDVAAQSRPRWFALDDAAMRERLECGPYLAHWVARVPRPKDLGRWQTQYPERIASVVPMARGDLTWRLTVPEDGAFPCWQGAGDGIVPTLIQWDTAAHPSARLPETGLALKALKARHPRAGAIREQLEWLGAAHLIALEDIADGPAALVAEIETPSGVRTLA